MARAKFTDAWLRRVATTKAKEDFRDRNWHLPGSFVLRVSATGAKSWRYIEVVEGFENGEKRKKRLIHTLGRYPLLTLDDARRDAERIARRTSPGTVTVNDLAAQLLERYVREERSPTTVKARERRLRLYILPRVGEERVADITTPQLQALVDEIESDGKYGLAADIAYTLRPLFEPVLRLGLHTSNPALGIKIARRDRSSRRGRTARVDIGVLARVWQACEALKIDARAAGHRFYARQYAGLQLQIACLQRSRVICELDRELLEPRWWVHPGRYSLDQGNSSREFRTKTGMPMAVPITPPLIRRALDSMVELSDPELRFLMASKDGRWPLDHFHANVLEKVRERAGESPASWWPHRCRKVATTLLHRDGVPLEEYRLALSHSPRREVATDFYVEPEPRDPVIERVLTRWNEILGEGLDQHQRPRLLGFQSPAK